MLRATRHIITLMLALMQVAVLHHSCTEVELCDVNNHPHLATLAFEFYLYDALREDGKRPEKMMIVANRVINAWRAGYEVDLPVEDGKSVTEGKMSFGKLQLPATPEEEAPTPPGIDAGGENMTPETDGEEFVPGTDGEEPGQDTESEESVPETDAEEQETDGPMAYLVHRGGQVVDSKYAPWGTRAGDDDVAHPDDPMDDDDLQLLPPDEEAETTPLYLKEGEYQFIAVNWSIEESEIDYFEDFKDSVNVAASELFLRYKTYHKNDTALKSLGRTWIDYNSYGRFMASEINPTYLGYAAIYTVVSGKQQVVKMYPKRITQRYKLEFSIRKDPGVRIEQVIAVMGGIPYRFGLSTRNVDVVYTNKMAFNAELHPDTVALDPEHFADVEATDSDTLMHYQACFNSIGLVRSKSPDWKQGPGILQLCIYTSTIRPGTRDRVNRTIYGMINLYNTIGEALPMVVTEDGKYMRQNGDSVKLDISTVLRISRSGILENPVEDNSIDRWHEVHEFDVDV